MSLKKDFINEVKEKKKKNMMGMVIDMEYYRIFLKENNEDEVRDKLELAKKEMKEEQGKITKDKNGRVLADNRDLKVINEITEKIQKRSALIDQITEIKNEQKSHERDYKDIREFYSLMNTLPESINKELDKIGSL